MERDHTNGNLRRFRAERRQHQGAQAELRLVPYKDSTADVTTTSVESVGSGMSARAPQACPRSHRPLRSRHASHQTEAFGLTC